MVPPQWLRSKVSVNHVTDLGTWHQAGHKNPFVGITLQQLKDHYAAWLLGGESSDGAVDLRPAHICPEAECPVLGYLDPKRWREHMLTVHKQ